MRNSKKNNVRKTSDPLGEFPNPDEVRLLAQFGIDPDKLANLDESTMRNLEWGTRGKGLFDHLAASPEDWERWWDFLAEVADMPFEEWLEASGLTPKGIPAKARLMARFDWLESKGVLSDEMRADARNLFKEIIDAVGVGLGCALVDREIRHFNERWSTEKCQLLLTTKWGDSTIYSAEASS